MARIKTPTTALLVGLLLAGGTSVQKQGFAVGHSTSAPGFFAPLESNQGFPPETGFYQLERRFEPYLNTLLFAPLGQTEHSYADNFSDHCGWPSGETEVFSYGCEEGSYRMSLKKAGPVHVTRNFNWHARTVTLEVDSIIASGRGTEAGQALLGIGCLADQNRGYVALLKTDGTWVIMRLEKGFTQLAKGNEPVRMPWPSRNRIGIVCTSGPDKNASLIRFTLNGQKIGSAEDKEGYGPFSGAALYADTFPGVVLFQRLVARYESGWMGNMLHILSNRDIRAIVQLVAIVIVLISGWVFGIRMRWRIRRALGRKVEDIDLTSIRTWMAVEEAEERKNEGSNTPKQS
jgi:hypothetical protein